MLLTDHDARRGAPPPHGWLEAGDGQDLRPDVHYRPEDQQEQRVLEGSSCQDSRHTLGVVEKWDDIDSDSEESDEEDLKM